MCKYLSKYLPTHVDHRRCKTRFFFAILSRGILRILQPNCALNGYRISWYSCRGNYSFFNSSSEETIQREETIQGRKLYEEIRYLNDLKCYQKERSKKKLQWQRQNSFLILLAPPSICPLPLTKVANHVPHGRTFLTHYKVDGIIIK